ncbi:MAG: SMP-30/gluconolaconase/LRE-like region family protein, partial [Burkholderia sp.]|nr:SMP-30/gluconolaconase/LRE-like region family protein [Burkholderia sp.]
LFRSLWPNVDAFNLTTGNLDTTLVNASPATVDTSSAIDAMYSIRAYRRSNGEYMVMKNNVKGNSITVYRWTP